MKKFALGAAVAALSLGLTGTALAQRTPGAVVVVVDTDRIYRECTACRAAQTQLQTQTQALQQQAQTLGQPIQTEMQSIQQAAQAARNAQGAAKTTAETQIQQRVQALQQRETQANQQLARMEQTLRSTQANVLQQINAKLNPIINQVMTQRNANLALDVNATLARANAIDVTNDVLTQLNQQLPSVNVVPLPTPPAPAGQPAQPQPQGR